MDAGANWSLAAHGRRASTQRITHHASLILTPPRYLASHRSAGRCPSGSPRGNPDGSPRPLRNPPWSPASGGNDVVGGLCGWGACLRCDVWMAACPHGPLAAHGPVCNLRASSPRSGLPPPPQSFVRTCRIGIRLPAARCVPIRAGAAPHAPRGGTLTVPQTPPQGTWSVMRTAEADASAAMFGWRQARAGGW
jgi:hypothetical protein